MGGMRGPAMGMDGAMAPMAAGMMAGMPGMPGQMLMLAPGTSAQLSVSAVEAWVVELFAQLLM